MSEFKVGDRVKLDRYDSHFKILSIEDKDGHPKYYSLKQIGGGFEALWTEASMRSFAKLVEPTQVESEFKVGDIVKSDIGLTEFKIVKVKFDKGEYVYTYRSFNLGNEQTSTASEMRWAGMHKVETTEEEVVGEVEENFNEKIKELSNWRLMDGMEVVLIKKGNATYSARARVRIKADEGPIFVDSKGFCRKPEDVPSYYPNLKDPATRGCVEHLIRLEKDDPAFHLTPVKSRDKILWDYYGSCVPGLLCGSVEEALYEALKEEAKEEFDRGAFFELLIRSAVETGDPCLAVEEVEKDFEKHVMYFAETIAVDMFIASLDEEGPAYDRLKRWLNGDAEFDTYFDEE